MSAGAAALLVGASLLGFDLRQSSVPVEAIVPGGPPRDGIPALIEPRLVPAAGAAFLRAGDRVIGVEIAGDARAYPLRVLNWHQVVNDRVADVPVAVTWCPLTASALAFDRRVGGSEVTFGVSGLLYQSNVLLYDRESESLWSQLAGRAVAGPRTGARLHAIAAVETAWHAWRAAHPATRVLSTDTGHRFAYDRDPYADYRRSAAPMFETGPADARLGVKATVLGFLVGDEAVAVPRDALRAAGEARLRAGGVPVHVHYDRDANATSVVREDTNAPVPATWAYWFAWSAIHPATRLWPAMVGPPAPPAGGGPHGTVVMRARGVEVLGHDAYWAELPGRRMGTELGRVLVVRGTLRNAGPGTIHDVRLVFELLDAAGRLVFRIPGYNRRAEALAPVDAPADAPAELLRLAPALEPIVAAGVDSFRMLIPQGEAAASERYRIVVTDVVLVPD